MSDDLGDVEGAWENDVVKERELGSTGSSARGGLEGG